ncbi:probable serine/threonine-protein kinase qkgA isoform X2 [Branchiostoma lanceolatum]|uniref:probable serine/threonine-protein kinase qkgA isoform X2 n=1 Tax=Branchiostoma lanceolatum TaxID=7740 RepID=UPI003453DD77
MEPVSPILAVSSPTWGQDSVTLIQAVQRGDVTKVNDLIKTGCDVNKNEEGTYGTPLTYAVMKSQADCVRSLISHGAEVDDLSTEMMESLWRLAVDEAEGGRFDILNHLLENYEKPHDTRKLVENISRMTKACDVELQTMEGRIEAVQTAGFPELSRALGRDRLDHVKEFLSMRVVAHTFEDVALSVRSISREKPVRTLYLLNTTKPGFFPYEAFQEGKWSKLCLLMGVNGEIRKIPSMPFHRSQLTVLVLLNTKLTMLPDDIGELTNLEVLRLSFNHLRTLPPAVGKCHALRYLAADHNVLRDLPRELGQLADTLVSLFVNNNEINKLPFELGLLRNLRYLSLENNPIEFPQPNILQQPLQHLLAYLRPYLGETVEDRTVRVVLMGGQGAGKTTLLHGMQRKYWIGTAPDPQRTAYIDIADVNLQEIQLRVFDLAGDDNVFQTQLPFLPRRCLYLVTFDLSVEVVDPDSALTAQLEASLTRICEHAPMAYVILVGTHVDDKRLTKDILDYTWGKVNALLQRARPSHRESFAGESSIGNCLLCQKADHLYRVSETRNGPGYVTVDSFRQKTTSGDLGKRWSFGKADEFESPHILGYFEVSGKRPCPKPLFSISNRIHNESVEQLKYAMEGYAQLLRDPCPNIPKKWSDTIRFLRYEAPQQNAHLQSHPIMPFDVYCAIAMTCGILSEEEITVMTQHFHQQGVFLHYSDSPELTNHVFLSTKWLTNQLGKLLSHDREQPPISAEGYLEHSILPEVWGDVEERYHGTLLSLFRHVGISVEVCDTKRDIFPGRIPACRPDEVIWTAELSAEENQITSVFGLRRFPLSFFASLVAAVERDRAHAKLLVKNPAVYRQNRIVYVSNSVPTGCPACRKRNISHGDAWHLREAETPDTAEQDEDREDSRIAHLLDVPEFSEEQKSRSTSSESLAQEEPELPEADQQKSPAVIFDSSDSESSKTDFVATQKTHFYLNPRSRSLEVIVRGERPCCGMEHVREILRGVFAGKPALAHHEKIVCPCCLLEGNPAPAFFPRDPDVEPEGVQANHQNSQQKGVQITCRNGHQLGSWRDLLKGTIPDSFRAKMRCGNHDDVDSAGSIVCPACVLEKHPAPAVFEHVAMAMDAAQKTLVCQNGHELGTWEDIAGGKIPGKFLHQEETTENGNDLLEKVTNRNSVEVTEQQVIQETPLLSNQSDARREGLVTETGVTMNLENINSNTNNNNNNKDTLGSFPLLEQMQRMMGESPSDKALVNHTQTESHPDSPHPKSPHPNSPQPDTPRTSKRKSHSDDYPQDHNPFQEGTDNSAPMQYPVELNPFEEVEERVATIQVDDMYVSSPLETSSVLGPGDSAVQ